MDSLIDEKIQKIKKLKEEKQVTLLAHYYQTINVHKVADKVGDSLGLSKVARDQVESPYILFAGVKFMAETASILNQEKTVLSPDISNATCPMADFLTPDKIEAARKKNPGAPVIIYVNTTAECKAHADVCCTSSNAIKICKRAAQEWKTNTILFGPDKNLAHYVRNSTNLNIITVPQDGCCPFHDLFTMDDVNDAKIKHPNAKLLVHPESPFDVQKAADFIGSTAQMRNSIEESLNGEEFIIGTEIGLAEYIKYIYPNKQLYDLSLQSKCEGMKAVNLDNIIDALNSIGSNNESKYEVRVPKDIAEKAEISISRMIDYS